MNNFEKMSFPDSSEENKEGLGNKNKLEEENKEAPEEEILEKKEENIDENRSNKPKVLKSIGGVAYKTITSIFGLKSFTDIGLAFKKKGDIYDYFNQKGKLKEEKKEIIIALDYIANEWQKRKASKIEGNWDKSKNKDLQEAINSFKEKLSEAESIPEDEKKEFKSLLASIVSERSKNLKKIENKKAEETEEVLKTYLQTKVKGTTIARDALNSALTATGLMAFRGAMYGGMALTERAQKANLEFSKEELKQRIQEGKIENKSLTKKERISHIIKDVTINATTETVRALTFRGKTKESKHKVVDFIQGLGTALRGLGIGGSAVNEIVNQGISGSVEESLNGFLDAFEEEGITGVFKEVGHNFADRFNWITKHFNSGDYQNPGNIENIEDGSGDGAGLENDSTLSSSPSTEVDTDSLNIPRPKIDTSSVSEDVSPSIEANPSIHLNEAVEPFNVGHLEYQGGTSVWGEIKNQLSEREMITKALENIGDETEATKTHLIDYLKDEIVSSPEKFGLPKDIDLDKITAEQMKDVKWDDLFSTLKEEGALEKALPNLSEEAKQNILDNNKILKELVEKTGQPLDSESMDWELDEIKEVGGVDEFLKETRTIDVSDDLNENLEDDFINKNIDSNTDETVAEEPENLDNEQIQEQEKEIEKIDKDNEAVLYYLKQYNQNDLPKNLREQNAELLINNASVQQMQEYPDIKNAVKEIYLNKIKESLNSFSIGGFFGPKPEELSEEISGLAKATGNLDDSQSEVFSDFVSQGEDMTKKTVNQFIDDNGNWDSNKFIEEIDDFKTELSKESLPETNEFVPRNINLNDGSSEIILVRNIEDEDGFYEYLRNGQKIKTGEDGISTLLKGPENVGLQSEAGGVVIDVPESSEKPEPVEQEESTVEEKPAVEEEIIEEPTEEPIKEEVTEETTTVEQKDTQPVEEEIEETVEQSPEVVQESAIKAEETQPVEKPEPVETINEENIPATVLKYRDFTEKSPDYTNVNLESGDIDNYDYYTLSFNKDGNDMSFYFDSNGERIEDGLIIQFIKQDINPEGEVVEKIMNNIDRPNSKSLQEIIEKRTVGDTEYFVYNKNSLDIDTQQFNSSEYFNADGSKMDLNTRTLIESGVNPEDKESVKEFVKDLSSGRVEQVKQGLIDNAYNYIDMSNGFNDKETIINNLTKMFTENFEDNGGEDKAREFAEWSWERYQNGGEIKKPFDFRK
jgi:hypothetical protein